jgi:hypothetical protein
MSDGTQLVRFTRDDVDTAIKYSALIKNNSDNKNEKKTAGEIIVRLEKYRNQWDSQVTSKQVVLKPKHIRLLVDIRDIFHKDFGGQLKTWQIPGSYSQTHPESSPKAEKVLSKKKQKNKIPTQLIG